MLMVGKEDNMKIGRINKNVMNILCLIIGFWGNAMYVKIKLIYTV